MLTLESTIRKLAPGLAHDKVAALASIWGEVVDRIMQVIMTHAISDQRELHINVKAEMTLELAKLEMAIREKVISKRVADRDFEQIDPQVERVACLGPEGAKAIQNTGLIVYQAIWLKRMNERWLPKSQKALERDANPGPSAKLGVKSVRDKHFISRWFIRDYWTVGQRATRWRKSGDTWSRDEILFSTWGHRPDLWSDKLEAYFGLLEGDGKKPVQMLLATEPLNQPQQLALIGFIVIHILRNPQFISWLRRRTESVLDQAAKDAGVTIDDMARAMYEALYQHNEVYDRYARPLLWSPWAIVTSPDPVFVLPDTFCARGHVQGELRIIVPLTPHKCFVTLAGKEREKRVVPFHHVAEIGLAQHLSQLLIQAAASECLSDRNLSVHGNDIAVNFSEVLKSLEVAVRGGPTTLD